MKVYQINVVCGNGSTGKIVVDLSKTIEEADGLCRIAYGRGNAPKGVNALKISGKVDTYWHAMMNRITDKHGLYSKMATRKLINDIKQYNPDIIHLHNIHGYYLNYEMLFRFLNEYNKPIVWTLHDCWAFSGHCAYFDYIKCDKWKEGCENCKQLKAYPSSYYKDNSRANYLLKKKLFTEKKNVTIITVSEWLNGVVRQSFFKDFPIKTIYNGIDLKVFQPRESIIRKKYGLDNKKIVLGVASIWDRRKGLSTFVELAQFLSGDIQIVLIGLTKKQYKEVPSNILCIERLQQVYDLVEWYSTADIYVNASVEETMGLTTVEAMACGTPVVVMNATAVPEVVAEGCGIVVQPDNIKQLSEAICTIQKTTKTSQLCINRANEFNKREQYYKYIEVYRELS